MKQYTVGNQIFRTQKDLVTHVQGILNRYRDGESLATDDCQFMMNLLLLHPKKDQKLGGGVASIHIASNPVYKNERSRFFVLRRVDGTETDFSFWECIRPTSHRKNVLAAFRRAISEDVVAFKQTAFDFNNVVCPESGELLNWNTAHVDHKAPLTFDALVHQFLNDANLDYDQIGILPSMDNEFQDRLADRDLEARWVAFHRTHADLQIVSIAANLSLRKRKTTS